MNASKSHALRFGAFRDLLPVDIPFVEAVRVLGVIFEAGSVSPRSWDEAVARAARALSDAAHFSLSLRTKIAVVITRVCAFAYLIARVAIIPRRTAGRLASLVGALIWDGGTALVARLLLHLLASRGGLCLPCIPIAPRALALVENLVQTESYSGRAIMLYLMSTARRSFYPGRLLSLQAEQPLSFYWAIAGLKATLTVDLPDVNITDTPPARVGGLVA